MPKLFARGSREGSVPFPARAGDFFVAPRGEPFSAGSESP
jgi:hypothetical protein